jgi:hypothetical protein
VKSSAVAPPIANRSPTREIDDEGAQEMLLDRRLLVAIRVGQHARPCCSSTHAREMPAGIETVAREIGLHRCSLRQSYPETDVLTVLPTNMN